MRIGIVHPNLNLKGGAEYVSIEFLNALSQEHELTLITLEEPDLEELNQFYSTDLEEDFETVEAPFPLSLFRHTGSSFNKLRNSVIKKYARLHQEDFDLMISTHNEAGFEDEGIQYIHFPDSVNEDKYLEGGEVSFDLAEGRSLIAQIYLKLVGLFLPGRDQVSRNTTLCNSSYTQKVFEEAYGSKAEVLNPPVSIDFEEIPEFEQREDAFVCIGRVTPVKDQKGLIRIFDRLNDERDLKLYIIGEGDSRYGREVKQMAESRDHVVFEGELGRQEIKQRITSVKYGIHNLRGEHYGLAPAEMLKGGCIVFVREKGGQTDIVGNREEVIFSDEDEAVEKIETVLEDENLRRRLREEMDVSRLNTPEEFRSRIREIVEKFE